MENHQYCLRWNNHHPNLSSFFKSLLELEELVDVTLSADGQQIKAHKIILSACSPYFKLLFSTNPCKHPVVILSGIKFTDLKTIVEFMYCGEINISDEQLPDILEAAESLQIRGLFRPNKKADEGQGSLAKEKNTTQVPSPNINPPMNYTLQQIVTADDSQVGSHKNSNPKTDCAINVFKHKVKEEIQVDYTRLPVRSEQAIMLSPDIDFGGEMNGTAQSGDLSLNISSETTYPECSPGPTRRRYTKAQQSAHLELALDAVRSGVLGFCKAAKLHGVNNRTLWLEYKKRGYPLRRPQPEGLALKQRQSMLGHTT